MHATVLVFGSGDLDTEMEPFSEHIEVDPYVPDGEYAEYHTFAHYKEDIVSVYGQVTSDFCPGYLESYKGDEGLVRMVQKINAGTSDEDLIADDEFRADYLAFMKTYTELDEDMITQEYDTMSTSNPKGKWDWYVIGGRWTGFFMVKPGMEHLAELGESGTGGNLPKYEADRLPKCAIDFERMEAAAIEGVEKEWCIIDQARRENGYAHITTRYMDNTKPEGYREETRYEEVKVGWHVALTLDEFKTITKDELIAKRRAGIIANNVHAMLIDGEWYESDSGFFGKADKADRDWTVFVNQKIAEMDENDMLTLVDYHF